MFESRTYGCVIILEYSGVSVKDAVFFFRWGRKGWGLVNGIQLLELTLSRLQYFDNTVGWCDRNDWHLQKFNSNYSKMFSCWRLIQPAEKKADETKSEAVGACLLNNLVWLVECWFPQWWVSADKNLFLTDMRFKLVKTWKKYKMVSSLSQ